MKIKSFVLVSTVAVLFMLQRVNAAELHTAELPTMTPTATAVPVQGDAYEVDSWEAPAIYTGKMFRSFAPDQDVDYILYHIKPGITQIQTANLTGAADTFIELYDVQTEELLGRDDDSGTGLASRIAFTTDREQDVLIVITNKALGYGEGVLYDVEIIPQANFTPTPTVPPTQTPRPIDTPIPQTTERPTQTPLPTYTPYPTMTPAPTRAVPRLTPTPTTLFSLRVEVFTDADADGILDIGEGVHNVMVDVNSLDRASAHVQSGYTENGILVLEIICPPETELATALEISVPYLQQTQLLDGIETIDETTVIRFILDAPLLPVQMP
jgi:hypothetical protein